MKRVIDIITASIGIVLLTPLWIIMGVMIPLEDPGPFFFTQTRVGRKGRHFVMYKFRSMTFSNAQASGRFDPGDTSRVTRIGKVLRKTKLDELPQLFNVFMGDMSLVGPRPEVPDWIEAYPDRWAYILSVRPGITDNASLEFRDEEAILAKSADPEATYRNIILPRKLELYEQYVRHRSLSADFVILWKTFIKVLFN